MNCFYTHFWNSSSRKIKTSSAQCFRKKPIQKQCNKHNSIVSATESPSISSWLFQPLGHRAELHSVTQRLVICDHLRLGLEITTSQRSIYWSVNKGKFTETQSQNCRNKRPSTQLTRQLPQRLEPRGWRWQVWKHGSRGRASLRVPSACCIPPESPHSCPYTITINRIAELKFSLQSPNFITWTLRVTQKYWKGRNGAERNGEALI